MSNTSKILKSVALAGALTAAGTVAITTAHADTTTTNATPTQAPAEATNADQQLANLKSQQTANENTVAQNNQATMASATKEANDQIADINTQIQQRQGKVASETAQVNADASSAIDQENAAYSAAVASQQAANDEELKAAQAKIVTPAQKAQQTAQENADYQSKAGNLSTAHNQNLNKIDADYQNQTKQINQEIANHDQAVKSATTNVDNQINAASDTVNTAQKAVDNAQTDLNDVQKAAQTSTSNTDIPTSTKGFIDHYNAQKFELPKAYVNGLRNVHDTASSDQFEQTINPDMKMFKMFDYQSDPDAAKEKVDVLHLTGQQILQLNLYSTRLINQIRAQFGMPAFKLNPQAIANAQRMANQESAGKMSGHHPDILKGAGENVGAFSGQITQDSTQKRMGLHKASGEHPDVWVKHGPNDTRLTYHWLNLSFKTMDDLQAGLFYTVTSMMFADSGQEACGHALNFSLWNQSPDSQMALGIESFANDKNPKDGSVYYRWIFTDSSKVDSKKNLDTTPTNAHGANIAQNYSAQIKSAQTTLTNAKQGLANAQNKLNTLKANRDQMIQDLVAKTDNSAVQKLQAKLKDIKASHDKAIKDENAKYNAELDKLTKAHQAKLDAIKAQSSDVNELKAQLQKKLDTLKANHEAKLAQIQKDNDAKIKAETQNDPEIAKLQARIATIKVNLAAQKKSLDDKYAALVASDKAAYQKLENQLKPSACEETAKGKNNSYTTADGKTVVLPNKSTTADGKTTTPAHETTTFNNKTAAPARETATVDKKNVVLPRESTVTDEKPVVLPHKSTTADGKSTVPVRETTAEGKTVVLPHKSTTADGKSTVPVRESTAEGKTVVLSHTSTTADSKSTVTAHESTVADDKPVALSHETGEIQTTSPANDSTVVRPEVITAPIATVNTTAPIATVNTTAPTMREEVKTQREGKLPQTGNQSALAAIVLGAASAIFGFGLAAKKRY